MSYPRHEYFRRTLCNLIGRDIQTGDIPDEESLVGPMIKNICYANAKNYLAFRVEVNLAGTRTRRFTLHELQCNNSHGWFAENSRIAWAVLLHPHDTP